MFHRVVAITLPGLFVVASLVPEMHASPSTQGERIFNAAPAALGNARGGAAASCAVAAVGDSRWCVLWIDHQGRLIQCVGTPKKIHGSAPSAVKMDASGNAFEAISLAGGEFTGWWLAARNEAGSWMVWHKPEWEDGWRRVADPGEVIAQPWQYCPGLVATDAGTFMPVLIEAHDRTRLEWLTIDSDGNWERCSTVLGNVNVPTTGFLLDAGNAGTVLTIDPTTGEALEWRLDADSMVAGQSESVWPRNMLGGETLGSTQIAIRSGIRVPGVEPTFPSAGLVVSAHREEGWSDLGFADENPDAPVAAADVALIGDTVLAAYVFEDGDKGAECRLVQVPLKPTALRPGGWSKLPSYPLEPGVAGILAGAHDGVLIAAGGANWEGGSKIWHDEAYVLGPGENAWHRAGFLPEPRAYAAVVSLPDGVLVAGCENESGVLQNVFTLRWDGDALRVTQLPPLPEARTSPVGEFLDGSVYVAGGYGPETPRSSRDNFWRLDLANPEAGWEVLLSWPGPTRGQAVMASLDGALYLMSGLELRQEADGKPHTAYLIDAYRYRPGRPWERLPDMPWSALAAPSPAPVADSSGRVFVLGGVDGRQAGLLPRESRLPNDILYFDVERNRWRLWPEPWPVSVVTVPAMRRGDAWVIPSGEPQAKERTTDVWSWRIDP